MPQMCSQAFKTLSFQIAFYDDDQKYMKNPFVFTALQLAHFFIWEKPEIQALHEKCP